MKRLMLKNKKPFYNGTMSRSLMALMVLMIQLDGSASKWQHINFQVLIFRLISTVTGFVCIVCELLNSPVVIVVPPNGIIAPHTDQINKLWRNKEKLFRFVFAFQFKWNKWSWLREIGHIGGFYFKNATESCAKISWKRVHVHFCIS